MKILHLSVVRHFSSGQKKQLCFEYNAARTIREANWVTIGFQDGQSDMPFIHRTPIFFRAIFLRNLWAWIYLIRESNQYDFILMRHMTFDPFSFIFSAFVKNRCSVHHAKEIDELKLIRRGIKGVLASNLERISGKFSIKKSKIIFGVTKEIADYQKERVSLRKVVGVYSNGVDVDSVKLLADRRSQAGINAVFISGKFSPWHGLDKLISLFLINDKEVASHKITIHLVGEIPQGYEASIARANKINNTFISYGSMKEPEYRNILEGCDFGFASLAMERQGLNEGSTLKVREMLAMGLPIYSGHYDSAFPEGSDFIRITRSPSIDEIIEFGNGCKKIDRQNVREKSIHSISKESCMRNVISILSK